MEEQTTHKSYSGLIKIIVVLVLLLAAFLIGYSLGGDSNGQAGGLLPGLTTKCEDSEKLSQLIESGALPPEFNTESELYFMNGVVSEAGDNYLVVTAQLSPLEDEQKYRVELVEDGQLVKRQEKDPLAYEAELENFDEVLRNFDPETGDDPPEIPNQFNEEEIELSEVEVGARVNIRSSLNIREQTVISADMISVIQ